MALRVLLFSRRGCKFLDASSASEIIPWRCYAREMLVSAGTSSGSSSVVHRRWLWHCRNLPWPTTPGLVHGAYGRGVAEALLAGGDGFIELLPRTGSTAAESWSPFVPRAAIVSLAPLMLLSALRYYWLISKGYRLRPWQSPYIRWRMQTFFGEQAANLDAHTFFRLLWRERPQLSRFLRWADERRKAQRARRAYH